MFINESQLSMNSDNSIYNYISGDFDEFNNIKTIPVIQFQESNLVSFEDLDRFCENNDYYLEDAIYDLMNTNNIDDIIVSIDESSLILYPELSEILPEYIVKPVNENDCVSIFVDNCVDLFLESGDEEYLDIPYMLNEASKGEWESDTAYTKKEFGLDKSYEDKKKFWDRDAALKGKKYDVTNYNYDADKKEYTAMDFKGLTVGKDMNILVNLKRKLTDAPKNVLAKAAARLRETYRKWLMKANQEHDSGKQAWYKKIARKIMQAVDWIMRKIENMHVNNYERAKKDTEDFNRSNRIVNKYFSNNHNRKVVGSRMYIYGGNKGKDIDDVYINDNKMINKALDKENNGTIKYMN